MEKKYAEICERISQLEHNKGIKLTEQQIDAIWFHRKAMKNSLDFIRQNPENELHGLHKDTFSLYYKKLSALLSELE